jgi:hypothetical protein
MTWVEKLDPRKGTVAVPLEHRGALWSLPGGQRLPNDYEDHPVALGDPDHPARLREGDLDNPDDFHSRLKAWLLRQG